MSVTEVLVDFAIRSMVVVMVMVLLWELFRDVSRG